MLKQAKIQACTLNKATCNMVPCNMQHETVQHAKCNMVPCNMKHGTMQHNHIIAGKHLKQAKCSSRQKVQARKSPSRHILQCRRQHSTMQQETLYHETSNMQHNNI